MEWKKIQTANIPATRAAAVISTSKTKLCNVGNPADVGIGVGWWSLASMCHVRPQRKETQPMAKATKVTKVAWS